MSSDTPTVVSYLGTLYVISNFDASNKEQITNRTLDTKPNFHCWWY